MSRLIHRLNHTDGKTAAYIAGIGVAAVVAALVFLKATGIWGLYELIN